MHSWFAPHAFFISHKELIGQIQVIYGIKGYSVLLESFEMYLIFKDLFAQYDKTWIIDHIMGFTDAFHLRWIVYSPQDSLATIHGITLWIANQPSQKRGSRETRWQIVALIHQKMDE